MSSSIMDTVLREDFSSLRVKGEGYQGVTTEMQNVHGYYGNFSDSGKKKVHGYKALQKA